ncbi:ribosomal protein S3 [Iris pallida]|uniref:Ribosomal protein S3 (Chloroplast) n=1 Tax=Iris pallida TaxID=29817 RepID=A0AAX6FPR4_IRIPA|nr:ribosomal protein S3 [Iris pallida]
MGQKINPLGFRLGTTQNHHSFWFAQPKHFFVGLQEDEKIRNCIKNYVQKNILRFRRNYRHRNSKRIDLIQVIIHIGIPNLLIEGQAQGVEELQMNEQKEFHFVNRRLNIAITRIEKAYGRPNILAEYMALQLKK